MPTLDELTERSEWIVLGTVGEIGAVGEDGSFAVTLVVERLLKGRMDPEPEAIALHYLPDGERSIDFATLRDAGRRQIFYLRRAPRGATPPIALADDWFGVEDATDTRIRAVEALVKTPAAGRRGRRSYASAPPLGPL